MRLDFRTVARLPSDVAQGWRLVGVRCAALVDGAIARFYPKENRIGLNLLSRVFADALEREGIECGGVSNLGTLNDGVSVLLVKEIGPALRAMREALEEMILNECVTLGYFCEAEMIWRATYPGTGATLFSMDELHEWALREKIELGEMAEAARREHGLE